MSPWTHICGLVPRSHGYKLIINTQVVTINFTDIAFGNQLKGKLLTLRGNQLKANVTTLQLTKHPENTNQL
jgi:hypothetical protein